MLQTDENWQLIPIKGSTGNTFYGTLGSQRAFIKRNSTPLLVAVAKEEIAPRLLWSRRTPTGDTMSAQEWINGGVLAAKEMKDRQINLVLSNLHRNKSLVETFFKMGKVAYGPDDLLNECMKLKLGDDASNQFLRTILEGMEQEIPSFDKAQAFVVHGDINHKNWVRSDTGKIYLVDWETAMLTSPLVDIAHILSHYIPVSDWEEWLLYSGYKPSDDLFKDILWYGKLSFLRQIMIYEAEGLDKRVDREIDGLREFIKNFNN
ncbi:phosphotransferase family protein [Streptococcaceae bacterium ESL0687]|nr:phosphotransferase family protein [Streptococcaceae bacterium ESL0687]